jgi:F-type H+-transporting ATPase subunit epsilon
MGVTVRIVTPRRVAFEGEAQEILAPGYLGEMGVLDGHERYLSVTRPGRLVLTLPEGPRTFVVGTGFMEVGPDHVTVLTDLCEDGGRVTHEQARKDLEAAEARLLQSAAGTPAWDDAQREADLARARLG